MSGVEEGILDALRRYWGFDTLRPLQREAIEAGLARRDSLVVLPTGGGKSLCYQIPPVVTGRLDIVVSPLISLMKDQVDGLREAGYPAAAIHSHLSNGERREIHDGLRRGAFRLLFVSPERLVQSSFLDFVSRLDVGTFAIDEAHCISHWGHDFRPEYRQLAVLKRRFPGASVHAYTATATQRVRDDIVRELGLVDPTILVGRFDRPNLIYRVVPRRERSAQVIEVLQRHPREAAIVYCISRRETEELAAVLRQAGIGAEHYHAGMEEADRARVQDDFAAERIDVVVATVAFGMGIDRSNVRCVIHASMPKSIEHYQQETGRAGRDGLEAECVLLYASSDTIRWEELIARSAAEAVDPGPVIEASRVLLGHMRRYATRAECRHASLSAYFGQTLEQSSCGACDVCLGEVRGMADSTVIAQKILSCIARTGQAFGVKHVADVLRGVITDVILRRGHHQLSTFGLLRDMPERTVVNLVGQVVDQGLAERSPGEYPTLRLNAESAAVMRGERRVYLIDPGMRKVRSSRATDAGWQGVDAGLFEHLRGLRKEIAAEHGVAAYVVMGDETLRALARHRPGSIEHFGRIRGIGAKRQQELGARFVERIVAYCAQHQLSLDVDLPDVRSERRERTRGTEGRPVLSGGAMLAAPFFERGDGIADVAAKIGRATSTVTGYLQEYIDVMRPRDVSAWVDDATYQRVVEATHAVNAEWALKPVFEHLRGEVPYDTIRVVMSHQRMLSETAS